jgi:STELLO glycosyltransferases
MTKQPTDQTIVITTINPPSATVHSISANFPNWNCLVVGDRNTPPGWSHPDVTYIGLEDQYELFPAFARLLPFDHYARKNIGYLHAMTTGANVIAETDDDNIPYDNFLEGVHVDTTARRTLQSGWVNVYRFFSDQRIWPRGFPLEKINSSLSSTPMLGDPEPHHCPIQQYLADEEPDVDAIYRLTSKIPINFRSDSHRQLIVLPPGSYCPFNSQNTVWWREVFMFLYLPSHVSLRMTDIWRSFIAQVCLHAMGISIAFGPATMKQFRNRHDLLEDFHQEIAGYLNNSKIVETLSKLPLSDAKGDGAVNFLQCYRKLVEIAIIPPEELPIVEAWIDAVTHLTEGDGAAGYDHARGDAR